MTDPDSPISVLYEHCRTVFDEMKSQARLEREVEGSNDEPALVYEGFLTKLFAGTELPTPYYSLVTRYLIPMGCVEQLRRGGSSTPSRWRILREPSEEAFVSVQKLNKRSSGKVAGLEQQVRDLIKLYQGQQQEIEALKSQVRTNANRCRERALNLLPVGVE